MHYTEACITLRHAKWNSDSSGFRCAIALTTFMGIIRNCSHEWSSCEWELSTKSRQNKLHGVMQRNGQPNQIHIWQGKETTGPHLLFPSFWEVIGHILDVHMSFIFGLSFGTKAMITSALLISLDSHLISLSVSWAFKNIVTKAMCKFPND